MQVGQQLRDARLQKTTDVMVKEQRRPPRPRLTEEAAMVGQHRKVSPARIGRRPHAKRAREKTARVTVTGSR